MEVRSVPLGHHTTLERERDEAERARRTESDELRSKVTTLERERDEAERARRSSGESRTNSGQRSLRWSGNVTRQSALGGRSLTS